MKFTLLLIHFQYSNKRSRSVCTNMEVTNFVRLLYIKLCKGTETYEQGAYSLG